MEVEVVEVEGGLEVVEAEAEVEAKAEVVQVPKMRRRSLAELEVGTPGMAGGALTRGRSLAEALAAWQQGRPPESTAELEMLVGLMLPLPAAPGQGQQWSPGQERTWSQDLSGMELERSQDLVGMEEALLFPLPAAPTSPYSPSSPADSSATSPLGTAPSERLSSVWRSRDSFSGLASVRLVTLQIGDDPSVEAPTAEATRRLEGSSLLRIR